MSISINLTRCHKMCEVPTTATLQQFTAEVLYCSGTRLGHAPSTQCSLSAVTVCWSSPRPPCRPPWAWPRPRSWRWCVEVRPVSRTLLCCVHCHPCYTAGASRDPPAVAAVVPHCAVVLSCNCHCHAVTEPRHTGHILTRDTGPGC